MAWLIWKLLIPLLILGILIVIHELGHFLVAKRCKVGIVSFSVGFGPSIFSKKIGQTVYKISAIPLGGYVQMVGEDPSFALDPEVPPAPDGTEGPSERQEMLEQLQSKIPAEFLRDKSLWFINKSLLQRTAIVIAGPLFNLISAYIFVLLMLVGYGEEAPNPLPVIGSVSANSPAEKAGLRGGDTIRLIDGEPVAKWEEFSTRMREGKARTLTVGRKVSDTITEELELSVSPERKILGNQEIFLIGVKPEVIKRAYSFGEAITSSASWIFEFSYQTLKGLFGMFIGQVSPKELAGPLAIIDAAGDHAEKGLQNVLYFMSVLSISLAILNLLPIPVLDGGHLMFFLIEAVSGPVSLRKREIANQVGLAALLLLMGVAFTNDIRRVEQPAPKPDAPIEWNNKEQKP
jgi:regulator of sigma E protease